MQPHKWVGMYQSRGRCKNYCNSYETLCELGCCGVKWEFPGTLTA